MLPSSKFGGTYPPQGFLLCKNPCGAGCDGGRGSSSQRGKSPAQRNFQRKFALRRVGSAKFVVPPTIEYSKVRSTLNWYNHPYRAAPGCQRGRAPLFGKESRGNPFKGSLWATSSPRLDTALLCAAKKRGVEWTRLEGFCQLTPGACATTGSKKRAPGRHCQITSQASTPGTHHTSQAGQ